MHRLLVVTLSIGLAGGATIVGGSHPAAVHLPPPARRGWPWIAHRRRCGTPSGTGTGSGLAARPSQAPPQRVEGHITPLESTRTERGLHVGDLTLWVQPSTAILVGCEKAVITDLQQGMRVKAAYEVKDGRNVAWVIEAEQP